VKGWSRRAFAESLAVAALAPLLGLPPESVRLPRRSLPAAARVGDDPGALAKALAEVIRTQYGARLSNEDLATITRQIQTGLKRLDDLKKLELANGDEPDFVFTPTRRPAS
jgi:hypothetical protein